MITLLFTLLSALYDNGKRFTNHIPRFIFRTVVVSIISYLEQGNFITNFILNTAVFYATFDYTLNLLEGRKWNYIGATAKIDLMWRKLGGWFPQLIFKILLLTTIFLK